MKIKNVAFIIITLLIVCFSYNVHAESENINKILSDGKLIVNSVYDKNKAIDYLNFYLSYKNGEQYSVKWSFNNETNKFEYYCNNDYSKCTIIYDDNDLGIHEEKNLDIIWQYDEKIKNIVNTFLKNISNEPYYFELNEIESIKYFLDNDYESTQELSNNAIFEYSSELKHLFNNNNFKIYPQGGIFTKFGLMLGGTAYFEYDGTIYAILDDYNVLHHSVLYVDDDENNIKEALEKKLSKYFGDIKVEQSITKTQYIEQYFDNIRSTVNTCKSLLGEYDLTEPQEETCVNCSADEYERKRNDYLQRYSLWLEQRNKIKYNDEVCSYYDGYNADEYVNGEIESFNRNILNGDRVIGYVGNSIDEIYTVTFKNGKKMDFFVIKDSSKVVKDDIEYKYSDIVSGIIVSTNSNIAIDSMIDVKNITSGEDFDRIVDLLNNSNIDVYDIKLFSKSQNEYVTKLDNGTFKIKIPISEKLKGKDLLVYFVDTNNNIEKYDVTIEDGYAVFYTNHLSIYVLSENMSIDVPETIDSFDKYLVLFTISVTGLSIVYYKIKMNN